MFPREGLGYKTKISNFKHGLGIFAQKVNSTVTLTELEWEMECFKTSVMHSRAEHTDTDPMEKTHMVKGEERWEPHVQIR